MDMPGLKGFLTLVEATERHLAAALLLWVFLEEGAGARWVTLTMRDLSAAVHGNLALSTISEAVKRLEAAGLIECRSSGTSTGGRCPNSYRVLTAALDKRLAGARSGDRPGLSDAADALLEAPETLQ